MAKHKVVHSEDACTIVIEGNKRSPEPTTAAIKLPGATLEVSRTSDGSYWVHLSVEDPSNVTESRIDFIYEEAVRRFKAGEPQHMELPHVTTANHYAVRLMPNVVAPTGE
jgi:hypothetical protein